MATERTVHEKCVSSCWPNGGSLEIAATLDRKVEASFQGISLDPKEIGRTLTLP